MKFTLLDTPYNLSLLAELGRSETHQPLISHIIALLYANMFGVIADAELKQEKVSVKTRIYKKDKAGVFIGNIIKKDQKAVVADVIRAGIQPSHQFYLKLCEILEPSGVRQDHIMSQRIETAKGVTGISLLGSKIGGSVQGSVVFIPDPMGATGHSMEEVISHYLKNYGKPEKFVIINLVVTPQYLSRLKQIKNADIRVYAARKDKGLTKDDYIIPGLGGVGEIINNTKK